MLEFPDAQAIFTSAVSWGLWKQLDKALGHLTERYGGAPEPVSAAGPDPHKLMQAVRQLGDEQSPLVRCLARAWAVRNDPHELDALLTGCRDLGREEMLVLKAVLAYGEAHV